MCGCDGQCDDCEDAKTSECQAISNEIQAIDLRQTAILKALDQSRQLEQLAGEWAYATGQKSLPTNAADGVADKLRNRLEALVNRRTALVAKVCDMCEGDLCRVMAAQDDDRKSHVRGLKPRTKPKANRPLLDNEFKTKMLEAIPERHLAWY